MMHGQKNIKLSNSHVTNALRIRISPAYLGYS